MEGAAGHVEHIPSSPIEGEAHDEWEFDNGDRARNVLAASQPKVLSEQSDKEPGEPEGQSDPEMCDCGHNAGRHDLVRPDGKRLEGFEGQDTPCELCSCIDFQPGSGQPDHGPGEPSEVEITNEMIERGVAEVDRLHAEDQLGFPGSHHTWVQRVLKAAHGEDEYDEQQRVEAEAQSREP